MTQQHPVNDFLTIGVKKFLCDVSNKKLNGKIVVFSGPGANGKSSFYEILRNVFNCVVVSPYIKDIEMELKGKNPDLVAIQECEDTELEQILKNEENKNRDVCLLITTNHSPKVLKEKFPTSELITVIEFKNIYSNDEKQLQNCENKTEFTFRKALQHEQIVNDDAVKIIKDFIETSSRIMSC